MDTLKSPYHGLRELALFAGAGGGILGGHLLGWRTVCAVEWEAYPAAVLAARQNDGLLPPFPIWDDVQTFDGHPWRGLVDVVSGGFPCQDISSAGKGAGIHGARSGMWKHMARIVREVGPRYVFVENSPMLTNRGLNVVLGDLAEMGYDAEWGVLGAHNIGAPHKRDRIWILAHSKVLQRNGGNDNPRVGAQGKQISESGNSGWSSHMAHAGHLLWQNRTEPGQQESAAPSTGCEVGNPMREGLEGGNTQSVSRGNAQQPGEEQAANSPAIQHDVSHSPGIRQSGSRPHWYACDPAEDGEGQATGTWAERFGHIWGIESPVGRVAHGVAARMERLKAIGNGQVSGVAATAFHVLYQRMMSR